MTTRTKPPTTDECFTIAAQTLDNALMMLDREMMDKLDNIASSWMALGALIMQQNEDSPSYN
ncbi:MAG: hypothetical protein EKK42_20145 [Pseudonocardiaceae bacterium]|nr:MAG: hypothetical protein EKK42_20145 [Pseudonocardiaceae bacterium]